jgi:pilus assembly protein CpaB
MSSILRLSIIMVLLLATAAFGLIAYNMNLPKPGVQVTQDTPAPPTTAYLVAARPLPVGTLARDEDFAVRSVPSGSVPSGAIIDTPEVRIGLRGSLVRTFLDAGAPVTSQDVLRLRDRGFLATVLAPNKRAISINVDGSSGVSGLIWPGDYVDVVLTQVGDKEDDLAYRTLSETVLHNVRIIAIDQEIAQGAVANIATAGKLSVAPPGQANPLSHTVSLELSSEEVKKIAVAQHLGKLSLAIRAADGTSNYADGSLTTGTRASSDADETTGTMFSRDVSTEIARMSDQTATVKVYRGGKITEYSVKKHDTGNTGARLPAKVKHSWVHAGDKGQGGSDER